MAVDPRDLTFSTALEARQSPPNEICTICLESLEDAPPVYSPVEGDPSNTYRETEKEAVITKVCGDKHLFHRVCIESWWNSANPQLNTCPIDRIICYGHVRIGQAAINLPEHAAFLGHNPHAHAVDYPDGFIGQLLSHYAARTNLQSSDQLPAQDGGMETLGNDTMNYHSDALIEGLGDDTINYHSDEVEVASYDTFDIMYPTLNHSASSYSNALPDRAIEDVQAPFAIARDIPCIMPEPMVTIGANVINPAGRNDPFADSIARGLLMASRFRPFSAEADPEAYRGLDSSTHMVGFFDDEDASGGADMG